MKTLSKEQVLILHARLIEATGGSNGIHDEGMLDSALANPFQSFGGKELYPSIQAKAAQLCFGLVKKSFNGRWQQMTRSSCEVHFSIYD